MQAASTGRRRANSARAASRSPPMWSPCCPTPTSKRRTATSRRPASRPAARSSDSGSSVACGESTAPVADGPPAQVGERAGRGESARTTITERRSQSVSRIVTGVSVTPRAAAEPPGADPGERRVPGDVDAARRPGPRPGARSSSTARSRSPGRRPAQPGAEPVPDRDDLGVVGDRAEQQRSSLMRRSPSSGRPQQRAADEVVERVGRRRHHPRRPRVAEQPLDHRLLAERRAAARRASRGRPRPRAASPAAALTSSTQQLRVGAAGLDARRASRRPAPRSGPPRSAAARAAARGCRPAAASDWPRCSQLRPLQVRRRSRRRAGASGPRSSTR